MARDPSEASRALRKRARARVQAATARGQRVFEAWKAIGDRQLAALDELTGSAFTDGTANAHDCVTDLSAFWVGCWADAMELLHDACSACLHPDGSDGNLPFGADGLVFEIEQAAEAADPQVIPGVSVADAGAVTVSNPLTTVGSPTSIPIANVRISTYRSTVLVSLVALGGLNLVPGTYAGANLVLDGDQVLAPITVTVT